MTRLLAHVEGRTEEEFVNEVLAPHLRERGYHSVKARLLGKARQRFRRGGIKPWPGVKKEIVNHLREDPGCVATTMVDYYGMLRDGSGAWPGRSLASGVEFPHKARTIEERIAAHVSEDMGSGFDNRRFVPYIMMHEYEAMLFSDCAVFATGIGRPEIVQPLQAIRDRFDTPEEIDDSPESVRPGRGSSPRLREADHGLPCRDGNRFGEDQGRMSELLQLALSTGTPGSTIEFTLAVYPYCALVAATPTVRQYRLYASLYASSID